MSSNANENRIHRYRSLLDSPPNQTTSQSASGSQIRETSELFESSGLAAEQLEDEDEEDEEEEDEDDDAAEGDNVLLNIDDVTGSRSPIKPSIGTTITNVDGTPAYDSDSSASGTDSLTWISWFCTIAGHEYFAEVAEDFIEDDFNLTGLQAVVPFYKEALDMILDTDAEDDSVKIPDVSIVESSAELLYGLIHQRYIITRQGLAQMNAKYENAHFGYCPRVFCHTSKVVPCGRSDLPGVDTVILYCPNCLDTYIPPSSRFNGIDGAFFGTTFPHLLFQTYRETPPIIIQPAPSSSSPQTPQSDLQTKSIIIGGGSNHNKNSHHHDANTSPSMGASTCCKIYGPRIYGFRVSERARSGSRMQWLRLRPRNEEELRRGLQNVNAAKEVVD